MTLKTRFFIWITGLLTIVVLLIGAVSIQAERRTLQNEIKQHHQQTVERFARVCAESMVQNDLILLNYVKILEDERGFRGAAFIDVDGHARVNVRRPERNGESVVTLEAPVRLGATAVGTAQIFLSQAELDAFFKASLRRSAIRIAEIMLAALVLGFLGSLVLARTLVKPIEMVVGGMRQVSQGHLDPVPVPNRKDELGWLGEELNVTIGKLKELDEMKRDFVAGVTHDLKSPLVALKGHLVTLLKGLYGAVPVGQRDVLVTMQNNATRLMRNIEDLLTAAKLEAKKPDLVLERFDIREVIKEVVELYGPVYQEKKLALRTELPSEKAEVWADKEQVFHVLSNLVSNAYKFTAQGSVTIQVQKRGEMTAVAVMDTGSGIPEKERGLIFEKFYQVKSDTKKSKGTGLGLYIVKKLIEEQGGEIQMLPATGGGSIFTFTLPHSGASKR